MISKKWTESCLEIYLQMISISCLPVWPGVKDDLDRLILPSLSEHWHFRCTIPYLLHVVPGIESLAPLCCGKYSSMKLLPQPKILEEFCQHLELEVPQTSRLSYSVIIWYDGSEWGSPKLRMRSSVDRKESNVISKWTAISSYNWLFKYLRLQSCSVSTLLQSCANSLQS